MITPIEITPSAIGKATKVARLPATARKQLVFKLMDAEGKPIDLLNEQPNPPAPTPAAPAPAPAAAQQEEGEPGFTGRTGDILQRALDASRAATATQTPPAPVPTPVKTLIARSQAAQRQAPAAPAASSSAAPTSTGSFLSNLFKSGPEVQSTGQQVVQRMQGPMAQGQDRPTTRLNWGDSDSAADFIRADKARQELEKSGEAFTGLKRGGAAQAPGKDAAHHKALEIIHHMLTRGH